MAAVGTEGALGASQEPALEIDDNNSAYAESDNASETTSVSSSLLKGHIENGKALNKVSCS